MRRTNKRERILMNDKLGLVVVTGAAGSSVGIMWRACAHKTTGGSGPWT
jgi:hypothetical protein